MKALPSDLPRRDFAQLTESFPAVADLADATPVILTQGGRDVLVLLAFEEYARLRRRDRRVHAIEDIPDAYLTALERERN